MKSYYKSFHDLYKYTIECEKEIERLKEDNQYLNKVNIELSTEKNRLNNIIKQIYKIFKDGRFEDDCDCIQIEELITRELKGVDKE